MPGWASTNAAGDAGAERGPHCERAGDAADELGAPVERNVAPREPLRDGKAEGDGRVDVAARDLADRIDERNHDEAEGHRDEAEIRA